MGYSRLFLKRWSKCTPYMESVFEVSNLFSRCSINRMHIYLRALKAHVLIDHLSETKGFLGMIFFMKSTTSSLFLERAREIFISDKSTVSFLWHAVFEVFYLFKVWFLEGIFQKSVYNTLRSFLWKPFRSMLLGIFYMWKTFQKLLSIIDPVRTLL